MALEVKGLDDITRTLENLGKAGDKIAVGAVKKSLKQALPKIRQVAPEDTGQGKKKLKVTKVKKYRKSVWGGLGIDRTNWEAAKGVYFQHYGYENHGWGDRFKGMRISKHVGWFDRATQAVEKEVLDTLENTLLSEIDKIL